MRYSLLILDFKKLHEAHFNKMESIDAYVSRKNKQIESFRNSVKELKVITWENLDWSYAVVSLALKYF